MSLQARLIVAILGALVAIVALGGTATVLHVRERIQNEMRSAHIVAEHRIARQIAELPASLDYEAKLRALIRTFDGDRHARLSLIGQNGRIIQRSHLDLPRNPAPAWFTTLFAPGPEVSIVPLPVPGQIAALELTVEPANHARDVWTDLGLGLTILLVFVCLSMLLVYVIARTSLRPLASLRKSFASIGAGRYEYRAAVAGPPEIRALAQSCNEMAERLATMAAENRRLSELVYRVQEEERAELARDLHDEIGPFLFAIDVDAAALESSALPDQRERAGAIRRATAHARTAVRRILANLRPGLLPGLGLRETLTHLAHDFTNQHAQVDIRLDIDAASYGAEADSTLMLVIREAMLNALRHARPKTIGVRVRGEAGFISFAVTDDGGGRADSGREGYGISGMRERIEAMQGTLAISSIDDPAGINVHGRIARLAAISNSADRILESAA